MNGIEIKKVLEELFPLHLADDWDNCGLQIGSLNKEVTNILVSLDLTHEVISEALKTNSNLIICHHPMIFKAIKNIKTDSYLGKMIETLIKNDIALYVMHTNFDHSDVGMNVALGKLLGLSSVEMLDPIDEQFGLGVVGYIKETKAIDLINTLKNNFEIKAVKYVGDLDKLVTKVGIIGGSGGSFMYKALSHNVDLYITGDVSYHTALDAKNLGLNILDIGHYFENYGIQSLKDTLKAKGIDVILSKVITDPYKFL